MQKLRDKQAELDELVKAGLLSTMQAAAAMGIHQTPSAIRTATTMAMTIRPLRRFGGGATSVSVAGSVSAGVG